MKEDGRILLNVNVNKGNRNNIEQKLQNVKDKLKIVGAELKEIDRKANNFIKTSELIPNSVKWNTKPKNYNMQTLTTHFNNPSKGQYNKPSKENTLVTKRTIKNVL